MSGNLRQSVLLHQSLQPLVQFVSVKPLARSSRENHFGLFPCVAKRFLQLVLLLLVPLQHLNHIVINTNCSAALGRFGRGEIAMVGIAFGVFNTNGLCVKVNTFPFQPQ